MAVTKIKAIKTRLKKAIDYITNPDKTDEKLLVSGYRCNPENAEIEFLTTENYVKTEAGIDRSGTGGADIKGYHLIQSFAADDIITPDKAHEVGIKWAKEVTGGNHQFVIATHVDKGHVHNHIIFNSYSPDTLEKFRTKPYDTVQKLREVSDKFCIEQGLQIIENPKGVGKHYKEWLEGKNNNSWKTKIQNNIEKALNDTYTYDYFSFKENLESLGVQVDDSGKYIKYKLAGQERFTRANGKSLSLEYSHEGIRTKIYANDKEGLYQVTINKKLFVLDNEAKNEYYTRVPFRNEYIGFDKDMAVMYSSGQTMNAFIKRGKEYTLYDKQGNIARTILGEDLTNFYKIKSDIKRDDKTETKEVEQTKEAYRISPNILYAKGVLIPLDRRAKYYVRKQRLGNIRNLANALSIMRKDNIKIYGDYQNRINELILKQEEIKRDLLEPIKQQFDIVVDNIKHIETYKAFSTLKEKLEKETGINKSLFEDEYSLELEALDYAEYSLSENNISLNDIDDLKIKRDVLQTNISETNKSVKETEIKINDLEKSKIIVAQVFNRKEKEVQKRNKSRAIER